jgi:hypothetical protein
MKKQTKKEALANSWLEPHIEVPAPAAQAGSLTKSEAIAAMNRGEKVRHKYFAAGEWVKNNKSDREYLTEDGCTIPDKEFWAFRTGEEWNTGWEIVPPPQAGNELPQRLDPRQLQVIYPNGGDPQDSNPSIFITLDGENGFVNEDPTQEDEDLSNEIKIRYNAYPELEARNRELVTAAHNALETLKAARELLKDETFAPKTISELENALESSK